MQMFRISINPTSSVNHSTYTGSASEDEWNSGSNFMSGCTKYLACFGYSYIPTKILNYTISFYIVTGHGTTPDCLSCLEVYLTAYLTGVVLLAAYSGALVSFLAVQTRSQLPFEGFQGLLQHESYSIGMIPGSAIDLFRVRDFKFTC
jgi:hypothetical protein